MVIAIINQKGGVGKTTLAVHLACHLFDSGCPVAFLDNDPQGSATRWLAAAAPELPVQSILDEEELIARVPELEGKGVLICDGAPRLNQQTHILMFFSDLVLIPVRPSTLDLEATHQTKLSIDRVAAARKQDGVDRAMEVRLILNMVRTVGKQGAAMREAIGQLGLPLADQQVGLRDAYSKAVFKDTVITRMDDDPGAAIAAVELRSLFQEILPHELRNLPNSTADAA